jgi:predicted RNase H-like HicB family nuclease
VKGLVAEMKRTFRAIASRDGRRWFIQVPDDKALFTQVRRLDQAERMIREVIGLMLEIPEDSFDVAIEPQMESLGDLRLVIEDAVRARQAADDAQEASSAAMRRAVRQVRSSGYTARDAGMLLGVSNQRISQIERSRDRKRTPTA